jgi:Cysteine-rich secretory protein family
MALLRQVAFVCLAMLSPLLCAQTLVGSNTNDGALHSMPNQAEQLLTLANQSRVSNGLGALQWDPALAAGALRHCMRMAQTGSISHRYAGEPDVTERAAHAGAHFSLIEENVAVGPYSAGIHEGWMNSPDHRANLLNSGIDRVGIAVVQRGQDLYAVADYAHDAPVLTQAQVEATVAAMLRARRIEILKDASQARAYCASSGRFKGTNQPDLAMRWQNTDVTALPPDLVKRMASGAYSKAAVGSCPAEEVDGGFTVYRVAVLLYGADPSAFQGR